MDGSNNSSNVHSGDSGDAEAPGGASNSPTSTQPSETPRSNSFSPHPYAPSNPSTLRESHRPPSTPSSSIGNGSVGNGIASHDYFSDHHPVRQELLTDEAGARLRRRHDGLSDNAWEGDTNASTSPPPKFTYDQAYHHILPEDPASSVADRKFRLLPNIMRRNTVRVLAKRHGLRHSALMYLYYYIPFFNWIRQYRWHHIPGDLTASITMASFYIPMALSYANNLAHVPAINGLYAFAINPIIYAIFGSCPQLIVGPEAAGSLLTGNVIRDNIKKGNASEEDEEILSRMAGIVTALAGAVLLLAGFARIGFLDNVLSRPFLRGFISAIGIVIIIDQLITEMGLFELASEIGGITHGSSVEKLVFLFTHIKLAHPLTCAVSFGSLTVIMIFRETKRWLQPRYPAVAYVPDRCLVVVITTIMSWKLDWASQGVAILGKVASGESPPFAVHWPFRVGRIKNIETALSTSIAIALLGFFESSVAARSLGTPPPGGIQGISSSPNRELIALGFANVLGGIFMAIPAFGGYGRSKVNASTGGKTPMSNIFLALITVLSVYVLLPAFRNIPKGVLSAMITVVGWSLIEEAPHDLIFFWKIRGYTELFLITMIFLATLFYSLEIGIAFGIGFSLLRVIKHSTRPRIQILGRARNGEDQFENAEADPERFELIEDCLIVKIPEPLTFANTGDLDKRLARLAEYDSSSTHPALPRLHDLHQRKNIIFDVHGVTSLDGAGAQVLSDMLQSFKDNGVRIFFCRVPHPRSAVYKLLESSGIVEIAGGPNHFVSTVTEALRLSKLEDLSEAFHDDPDDV